MRTAYTKTSGVVRADGESGTTGIEYPRNLCKVVRSTLVEARAVSGVIVEEGSGARSRSAEDGYDVDMPLSDHRSQSWDRSAKACL